MYDDEQKQKMQENLTNPKNRFLGFCCHASEIDNAWGMNWSFPCGVVFFSIIMGACTVGDIIYLAEKRIYQSDAGGFFKFMVGIKIFSIILTLASSILSCFGVYMNHYRCAIISYWMMVASFLLASIVLVYMIIAIFSYPEHIEWGIAIWGIEEFGLLLYCWILFCHQVNLGRQRSMPQSSEY